MHGFMTCPTRGPLCAATAAQHVCEKLLRMSVQTWVNLKVTATRSEFVLAPPPGMQLHTPAWAASRAPLALAVEDFDPWGCDFHTPKMSAKSAKHIAAARTARPAAAAEAALGEKKVIARIGKGLSSDGSRSADHACVTYSVRSKVLKFADVGTDCLAEVGRVDIRFFQLFRDAGELPVRRVYAGTPQVPVKVHLTTMQLLAHLGVLPRPSLPALLALFVWGLARCAVAMRETKQRVPNNIWHIGVAEAITIAWCIFHKGPFAEHEQETDTVLSVLACLPRTLLVQTEMFDGSVWDGILEKRQSRQGQAKLDAVRAVTATEAKCCHELLMSCTVHASPCMHGVSGGHCQMISS